MAERICSIEGCEKRNLARGWCGMHYMRWRTHGDPHAHPRLPLAERFAEKVNLDGPVPVDRSDLGPCHIWIGRIDRLGYGRTSDGQRELAAHRVAYELAYGPVPDGLEPDHLCRNRACVNARHLEAVTHRVNTLRGDSPAARCARQTHCIHGHPFDEQNTRRRESGRRDCRACDRERGSRNKRRIRTENDHA